MQHNRDGEKETDRWTGDRRVDSETDKRDRPMENRKTDGQRDTDMMHRKKEKPDKGTERHIDA